MISKTPYNFACVKVGKKYTFEDVNRLFKNIKKLANKPFDLYCLTDDDRFLDKDIKVIFLDKKLNLDTVWWKLCLFYQLSFLNNKFIYFDLDVVVQKNPISLFQRIEKNKITVCNRQDAGIYNTDSNLLLHPAYVNSSIIGFHSSQVKYIFNYFMKNPDYYMIKYIGIDRFISTELNTCYNFFDYSKDYYFRCQHFYSFDQPGDNFFIRDSAGLYGLVYDPSKTVCVITQARPVYYKGLEEYFI